MAIEVRFEEAGPGTCGWCRKQKDTVYTVAFGDKSFVGALCKADLLRAVEMKCPVTPSSVKVETKAAVPLAVPTAKVA